MYGERQKPLQIHESQRFKQKPQNMWQNMDVDTDQKQARNTQQTTNWQRENNDAGNNLAWHAASATGSRTYMGPHQTGDPSSYIQKTFSGITPDSQIMNGNVITPGLNTCRQSLHFEEEYHNT